MVSEKSDFLFKVLLMGQYGAGKTSIGERYFRNEYSEHYCVRLGVDFWIKRFKVLEKTGRAFVWDPSGTERFGRIHKSYYRGFTAAIFVFDVTCMESFDEVDHWFKEASGSVNQEIISVLVGTKIDLKPRSVEREAAEKYARSHNMMYLEVSSKEDINIKEIFSVLLPQLVFNKIS
mmetsp:Transcript_13/g.14  ORF Transcript_13/g.14 Transcript_13/m.14 type:complete len:176 (+) Transcript_13:56-583(+)